MSRLPQIDSYVEITNHEQLFGSNHRLEVERGQLWCDRNLSWTQLRFLTAIVCQKFQSRSRECTHWLPVLDTYWIRVKQYVGGQRTGLRINQPSCDTWFGHHFVRSPSLDWIQICNKWELPSLWVTLWVPSCTLLETSYWFTDAWCRSKGFPIAIDGCQGTDLYWPQCNCAQAVFRTQDLGTPVVYALTTQPISGASSYHSAN